MNNAPRSETADSRAYLVLEVGAGACALHVEDVAEVLPRAALSPGAGAPSLLAGFLNLEGATVPVVALSGLLHGVSQEAAAGDVLIMLRAEPPVALLATGIREVVRPPEDSVVTVSQLSVAETAVIVGDQVIPILRVDRLLLAGERRRLAELQAAEQRRLAELEHPEPAPV